MILEVLDSRAGGVRSRLPLKSLPLTVGRGYGNDLILDDPYVDARHASIGLDGEGGLVVEDLGSVNGLVVGGAIARSGRVPARPGTEVRVGRTVLRFRGADEPVAPALRDVDGPAPSSLRFLSGAGGRFAVSAAAIAVVMLHAWLGSYERGSSNTVFEMALGFTLLCGLWAGIWAVAGRIVVHRFHYLGHFAIGSLSLLVSVGYAAFDEWLAFVFPDNRLSTPLAIVAGLAVVTAVVAGHLALASGLPRQQRWRVGLATSGVLIVLLGAAVLAESESFSDVPEFSGVLKPLSVRFVPMGTVEGFGTVVAALRDEVDALAADE